MMPRESFLTLKTVSCLLFLNPKCIVNPLFQWNSCNTDQVLRWLKFYGAVSIRCIVNVSLDNVGARGGVIMSWFFSWVFNACSWICICLLLLPRLLLLHLHAFVQIPCKWMHHNNTQCMRLRCVVGSSSHKVAAILNGNPRRSRFHSSVRAASSLGRCLILVILQPLQGGEAFLVIMWT